MAPSRKQTSSETRRLVIDLHTTKDNSIGQIGKILNLRHSSVFDIIKRYKN